ncbi:preprotein translocase subunit YajC [Thorsellia anophelis]|uniref:Sec translocon accessory complex subunit YajC n=1 Tax=Thorsellia anophelis DSM 18579 TaxID=1123402 RepID=A0A1I0BZ28_9GAMM|nr:preprotein translocase subunit YajC [Thorsellia anophelis]SET12293.1 preprotein translocase subunit YajC [Thorsellia anophelis DSM 18579]
MSFFISSAHAAAPAAGAAPAYGDYGTIIIMLAFGLIFYFMIIRPQQKRAKAHKELMNSISKGNEVLTNGGLIGRVTKVSESGYISIALNENNEVIIKRDFIAAVLPKGTMKELE